MSKSFASVADLDKHLSTRSYVTGYSLSADDKAAYQALSAFPDASTPHALRWALHVQALLGSNALAVKPVASAAKPAASKPAPAAAVAKKTANDDNFLFDSGDEEEDEEARAATKARQERMALAKKLKDEKDAKDGKKKAEKAVEKSLVVLEVKPWEADTDLKMVWEKIIEYKQDGLVWGATYKLEPVAYGIMKLVMTVAIEDAKVLMDDITENIEALEEWVQSVQVASMNKI